MPQIEWAIGDIFKEESSSLVTTYGIVCTRGPKSGETFATNAVVIKFQNAKVTHVAEHAFVSKNAVPIFDHAGIPPELQSEFHAMHCVLKATGRI